MLPLLYGKVVQSLVLRPKYFLSTYKRYHIHNISKMSQIPKQNYDYFLILDFEATCDDKVSLEPQVRSSIQTSKSFCL